MAVVSPVPTEDIKEVPVTDSDSTPTPNPNPTTIENKTTYPDPKEVESQVTKLINGWQESKNVPLKLKDFSIKYNLPTKIGKVAYYGAVAYPEVHKFVNKCKQTWKKYEKYDPADLIPALVGFFMAFFGGSFLVTIAAFEAFRGSGAYHTTMKAVDDLTEEFKTAMVKNAEDDKEDLDGDGIADVKQISDQELLKRKLKMIFKCINPERVMNAIGALYAGFIAVIAALKIQFARSLALGNSIGEVIAKPVLRYGEPKLDEFIPQEYRKWNKHILSTICKIISVTVAWYLQRVISTVHSAVKGGSLFAEGIVSYLITKGHIPPPEGMSQEKFLVSNQKKRT